MGTTHPVPVENGPEAGTRWVVVSEREGHRRLLQVYEVWMELYRHIPRSPSERRDLALRAVRDNLGFPARPQGAYCLVLNVGDDELSFRIGTVGDPMPVLRALEDVAYLTLAAEPMPLARYRAWARPESTGPQGLEAEPGQLVPRPDVPHLFRPWDGAPPPPVGPRRRWTVTPASTAPWARTGSSPCCT